MSRYAAYDIEDERHTMEDVIDEFVEEINEEEMLQQQQQLEPKRSKRKRKTESLKTSKKTKDEPGENKSVRKRSLDPEQDDSAKIHKKVKKQKSSTEWERLCGVTIEPKYTGNKSEGVNENEKFKKSKKDAKEVKVAQTNDSQAVSAESHCKNVARDAKVAQVDTEEEDISKIEEFIRSQVAIPAPVPEEAQLNITKDTLNLEKSAENPPNGSEQKVVSEKKKRGRKKKQVPLIEEVNILTETEKEVTVITENEKVVDNKVTVTTEDEKLVDKEVRISTESETQIEKVAAISTENEVVSENSAPVVAPVKKGRKKGRKRQNSTTQENMTQVVGETPSEAAVTTQTSGTTETPFVFKPVSDWKKLLKMPSNFTPLSTKHLDQQIFQNPLQPYAPCVPRNTSKRLIEHLTDKDLEQVGSYSFFTCGSQVL